MSWMTEFADDDCCDIVTTGRTSGLPRQTEIWFGVIGDTMYLVSGNGVTADWYRNLMRTPTVDVIMREQTFRCVARAVTDAEERRRCGDVMRAKYDYEGDASIGLTYDDWCYHVPAVALT